MRPKLALKNIWRSPARSIFIFILLVAVTFALFSQVMEYSINSRETERAIELYDGVGTVENALHPVEADAKVQRLGEYIYTDPRVPLDYFPEYYAPKYRGMQYRRLDSEIIDEISQMPYVTYTDTRYMTAGVSEEYQRLDMSQSYYFDFTNCYVVEATVEKHYELHGRTLVTDFEIIGGNSETNWFSEKMWINYQPYAPVYKDDNGNEFVPDVWTSGAGLVTEKGEYTVDYAKNLQVGKRYVFVVRIPKTLAHDDYPSAYLTDQFAYDWCDGIWSLEGEPDNYLETEKFAPLQQYIDLIETDLYTFDVVYTKNMGSIRYLSDGTIGIREGRRLTYEDYTSGANVCVINHDVAREYGLEVGDTITLDLGNRLFEQYEGIGAVAAVPQRLSTEYTEVTLEIVGIWKDIRGVSLRNNDPCWSYSVNTVFVPTHLLSVGEEELANHTFAPGEFSFVIENIYDVAAFESECTSALRKMMLGFTLDDGNWEDMVQAFEETKQVSVIKIIILSAAVFSATCFTVFLYVLGRKRDYAVMRVLGTTTKKARETIVLPLMVLTSFSVVVGTAVAWIYTRQSLTLDISVTQMTEYKVDTSIPVYLVIASVLIVLLLALGAASLILGFIGRRSPLVLLQDTSQKRQRKKKTREEQRASEPEKVELGQWVSLTPVRKDGKKRRFGFIWRYVTRNLKRTKAKAVLFILVSALLLNVSGQLNILLESYKTMYEETEVVSNYAGSLNLDYVSQLQESGYVKDVFYRSVRPVDINTVTHSVCITNDIERYMDCEVEVTYLDGYDDSVMQSHQSIAIVDKSAMERYGFELGDTIYVTNGGQFWYLYGLSSNKNSLIHKHGYRYINSLSDEELAQLALEEATEWYYQKAEEVLIVGVTNLSSANIYMPGTLDMNTAYGKLVILQMTEATLIDNSKHKEYREYGRALADANMTYEIAFIMDTTKLEQYEKMIMLLEILYPVSVIAMLVIGAFLTCLIIVQTSKDVAIMRVLGTSKARTRVIIIAERMVLCIIGMVLAVAVMFAMRGVNEIVLRKTALVLALYFVTVLAASCIASIAVSRKNVLELLQTKE